MIDANWQMGLLRLAIKFASWLLAMRPSGMHRNLQTILNRSATGTSDRANTSQWSEQL